MFSDKLKIVLLTLIFAVGSPFILHASDEQLQEAQRVDKKRSRPQEIAISSTASSVPDNSNDDTLVESQAKYRKLEEDAKSSSATSLRAIDSSQESSVSPDFLLSELQPKIGYVPSPVAAPSAPSRVKPSEEDLDDLISTYLSSSPPTTLEMGHVPPPVATPSSTGRIKSPEEESTPEETTHTCEESRIKTNKLAYFYENEYFDFTEWESETAVYVEKIRAEFRKTFRIRTMNIALAQLTLIYKIDTKTRKIDFMLPCFFMSR